MSNADRAKGKRVADAMMRMGKLDIADVAGRFQRLVFAAHDHLFSGILALFAPEDWSGVIATNKNTAPRHVVRLRVFNGGCHGD